VSWWTDLLDFVDPRPAPPDLSDLVIAQGRTLAELRNRVATLELDAKQTPDAAERLRDLATAAYRGAAAIDTSGRVPVRFRPDPEREQFRREAAEAAAEIGHSRIPPPPLTPE
jgi:hypothetical protein